MTIETVSGALKKFRRTPWKFQATFHTPLPNLPSFVSTLLAAHGAPKSASIIINQIVFDPVHLNACLKAHSLAGAIGRETTITALEEREVQALLEAALADWVDFAFVPAPKPFVIYADHDEYTTIFANSKSNLNRVDDSLTEKGFERVEGYERRF